MVLSHMTIEKLDKPALPNGSRRMAYRVVGRANSLGWFLISVPNDVLCRKKGSLRRRFFEECLAEDQYDCVKQGLDRKTFLYDGVEDND